MDVCLQCLYIECKEREVLNVLFGILENSYNEHKSSCVKEKDLFLSRTIDINLVSIIKSNVG